MSKGQAFLSDFAISIALFTVIIGAFFFPWNSIVEAENRFSEAEEMKNHAVRTMSFLVATSGYPDNWQEESVNVSIPGFSREEDNVISIKKLSEFGDFSTKKQSSLLKVDNFYLEIKNSSGIMQYRDKDLSYGVRPTPERGPETVVKSRRNVMVEFPEKNVNGEITLVLWR